MPQDQAILGAARAGIQALKRRHAEGRDDRFYLVHRVRQWNPSEASGWAGSASAQDRGVEPLLRGATDTSFSVEAATPPSSPACATASRSTRHAPAPRTRQEADRIAAHPLHQPHFDARVGRVTEATGSSSRA